ncbi:MAG: nucleoside triphosphate pyrophosphohydrolase [Cyanobacteria bacterium J06635_1]
MRKVYSKLVRDKVPSIIAAANKRYDAQALSDTQYQLALKAKLVEEALEVQAAASPEDLVAELADVLEVMAALMDAYGLDAEQVKSAQADKRARRGGFETRIELLWVEEGEAEPAVKDEAKIK